MSEDEVIASALHVMNPPSRIIAPAESTIMYLHITPSMDC
jgi:hypothetical protein